MADALKDLAIVPVTSSDTNYFLRKVTGLKIDKVYSFKFQWVLEDGTLSEWSPGYQVSTPTESVPAAPSVTIPSSSTGSIPVTLSSFPTNAKRVDIYVIGGEFGTGKVADYFLSAGTKSIAVSGGTYEVSLITVTPSGVNGTPTNTFTIEVSTAGETIQAPTNPNGFSIDRILGGIQVNWAGTYANGTFTGFEAIKIYVGDGPTATSGTYIEAGVMTGNNVKNSITVPVDGTYLRYDQPVYVHAAAVNKSGEVGTIQANVANNSLGARTAISSDLANQIITNTKLVDDAVTAAKIATSAITTTKIADDAITSAKVVANAITADKITSSAITSDKIAANAITAGKILAGEIDVTKLAAGTISVNNLEAGTISSTSYVRAGSKAADGTGARVEIASSTISQPGSNVLPGFYIYNSAGTPVLSAPIGGGLSIVGSGSFSGDISGASGTFGGALNVGTTVLANITGATSVTVNSVTRVRFTAQNALNANDVVTISGIAQNQVFAYWSNPPTNTIPVYNYYNNPFNLGTVTVYEAGPTYFDIQSGVTGTYTSGGTATGTAFKVTSTGIARAAAGQIGGWVIDITKLRSASGSISLDPITPQITVQGSGSYSGYNITIAAPTGITAGSTFSVTPAGYLSSTSGSIAGWNINNTSISKSVASTDIFGNTGTLTTTLGSDAKITVSSDNAPSGYANLGIDSAILTQNATQKFEIGPNGIGFINRQTNLGIQGGYMRMWTNSGDSQFYIYWDGWKTDTNPETYSPFQWKWVNYSVAAERLTHIVSSTYDTTPQVLRPLVIDNDGTQYLGATSYFSTTQTTTPSSGTGQNGDYYYSTA